MPARILVPLDGCAGSESVLAMIRAWNHLRPTILLFHSMRAHVTGDNAFGEARFSTPEDAHAYLEELARPLQTHTQVLVVNGVPEEAIATAVVQQCADLVFLGQSGDPGSPWRMTRLAERVTRCSPKSVVLIRTPVGALARPLRRILAPVDAAFFAADSLQVLRGLAYELRAEVILLQVESRASAAAETFEDAASGLSDNHLQLINLVWSFLRNGIPARSIVTRGSMPDEIAKHERWLDVDLVALPKSRADTAFPSWWTLEKCERPVLLYEVQDVPFLGAVGAPADALTS